MITDNTSPKKAKPINANTFSHDKVLEKLIQSVEVFDFTAYFFPEKEGFEKQINVLQNKLYLFEPDGSFKPNPKLSKEDAKPIQSQLEDLQSKVSKFKLNQKHFIVGTVHHILETAKKCNWGLCKNLGFVYVFNGEFWKPLEEDDLKTFLSKAAKKAGVQKVDALHYEFVDKLNKQFLLHAHLPNPKGSDEYLINLQNGTFKISNGKFVLKDFDRNDFLKYQLPFAYDPEATAPTFLRFIDEVLPDPERQMVLAEFFGHLFTNIKLEKALLCFGGGANGKSVFFEIINAMLGSENVSNYSLQSLTEEKGYHRAMLANKLINYASEISGKLKTDLFKGLASGEKVEARHIYKQPFIIENYARLAFNTNELPREVEHTEGYFRRFLIVPFDVTIPVEKRDPDLPNKIIKNELAGVFNWVLEGLNRVIENKKFTPCKASDEVLKQFKYESDSAKQFLEEYNYTPCPEGKVHQKFLYSEYRQFCIGDGMQPLKKLNFRKRLESFGIVTQKDNNGLFYCIKANH